MKITTEYMGPRYPRYTFVDAPKLKTIKPSVPIRVNLYCDKCGCTFWYRSDVLPHVCPCCEEGKLGKVFVEAGGNV